MGRKTGMVYRFSLGNVPIRLVNLFVCSCQVRYYAGAVAFAAFSSLP
jgi:hypothetical protein